MEQRLRPWLAARFGPGGLVFDPITGGQSCPTFRLNWGDRRMVLRKQPDGPILKGAHAVDREYRVLTALESTDVPVPTPIHFEANASVLGTP